MKPARNETRPTTSWLWPGMVDSQDTMSGVRIRGSRPGTRSTAPVAQRKRKGPSAHGGPRPRRPVFRSLRERVTSALWPTLYYGLWLEGGVLFGASIAPFSGQMPVVLGLTALGFIVSLFLIKSNPIPRSPTRRTVVVHGVLLLCFAVYIVAEYSFAFLQALR